jgi:predicted DNA-binding protein
VTEKRSTSFRLSDDALRLLAALSKRLGISQAACLELGIRELAKRLKES